MRGTWDGYYKYNNAAFQKALGFDSTSFIIEINTVTGKVFEGTVKDDPATGGMDGIGKITGIIRGKKISFRKNMPYGSQFDLDGNHYNTAKKHPTLYYSGTFSESKTHVEGKWKFGIRVYMLFRILPIPYRPGSGTWEITLRG